MVSLKSRANEQMYPSTLVLVFESDFGRLLILGRPLADVSRLRAIFRRARRCPTTDIWSDVVQLPFAKADFPLEHGTRDVSRFTLQRLAEHR